MTVLRIVPNLFSQTPAETSKFYEKLLGLEKVMEFDWIVTLASDAPTKPQISIASEGGSNTPVPDLSIEVDDVELVYQRAQAAEYEITYPLTKEPWGVLRFYVKDPSGKLLNIISHLN